MTENHRTVEINFMSAGVVTLCINPVYENGRINTQDSTLCLKAAARDQLVFGCEDDEEDPFWISPDGVVMMRDFLSEELLSLPKEHFSDPVRFTLIDFVQYFAFKDEQLNTLLKSTKDKLSNGNLFDRLGAEQFLFPGLQTGSFPNLPTVDEPPKKKAVRKKRKPGSDGFVYLIGNLEYGSVKIGFSSDPASRLKGIQTGCPFQVSILAVKKGSIQLERKLHEKFAEFRDAGEWFVITESNQQLFADAFSNGIQGDFEF